MHFLAATFLFAFSLIPTVLSQATSDARGNKCNPWDPTRSHPSCDCLPGFDTPSKPKEECLCPDEANTWLNYDNPELACCICVGGSQTFSVTDKKCLCDDGFHGTYSKKGVLTCTRTRTTTHHSTPTPTPTPTGTWGKIAKRSLHKAIKLRESNDPDSSHAVEDALGCMDGEKACEAHGSWSCTDTMSSLASCGGCPGEGLDCEALPGVNTVSCSAGRCAIDSCRRGFAFKSNFEVIAGSNISTLSCVPSRQPSLFQLQAETGG